MISKINDPTGELSDSEFKEVINLLNKYDSRHDTLLDNYGCPTLLTLIHNHIVEKKKSKQTGDTDKIDGKSGWSNGLHDTDNNSLFNLVN